MNIESEYDNNKNTILIDVRDCVFVVPNIAKYTAIDKNGKLYWYDTCPIKISIGDGDDTWELDDIGYSGFISNVSDFGNWEDSLKVVIIHGT